MELTISLSPFSVVVIINMLRISLGNIYFLKNMTLYFFILYRKKAERLFSKEDDYDKFSLLYNIILNNILCGSVDNNNA
ncbi:mutator MutT protein [Prevotella pallens ATCC 700821]|uniref:Mutator MutT protein n=1 Tax=Prevotella pallens ATCC 700821 TaxID=997353 RepID=F9DI93_9BACT|nr:mutator MutT protein [Prevotella pallens ATCC 700821]